MISLLQRIARYFEDMIKEDFKDQPAHMMKWMLISLTAGVLIVPFLDLFIRDVNQLILQFYPEIVGIGFTVLFLNRIYEKRRKQEQAERDQKQTDEQWKRDQSQQVSILKGENIVVKRQPIIDHMKAQDLFKRFVQLDNTDLREADLWSCNMENAQLVNATLLGAVMRATNLQNAMLHNANLLGAVMIDANLEGAYLVKATLPDDTKYTSDTNMGKFTDSTHPEFKDTLETINAIRQKWGFPSYEIISISRITE